jgi:hypothetical protein
MAINGTAISPDAILLRRREVAAMIGVTERTVERWADEGLLQRVKISGTSRYRRADMEALAVPQNESSAETSHGPNLQPASRR